MKEHVPVFKERYASFHSIKFSGKFDTVCSWVAYLNKDNFWQSTSTSSCSPNLRVMFLVTLCGVLSFFQLDLMAIVLGYIFHPPVNFMRERETNLIWKQWSHTEDLLIGKKLTTTSTLLQPRQKSKWKMCEGLASTVHFVITMESTITINPWSHVFHK